MLIFSAGVLLLSFLIIRPLMTPLLAALILSYFFYPLYILLMDKVFKNRNALSQKLSALLVLAAIICVVLVPTVALIVLLFKNIELQAVSDLFNALSPRIVSFITTNLGFLDKELLKEFGVSVSLNNSFAAFFGRVFIIIRDMFSQIPQFLLGSFVTLFVSYYLLRNAQPLVQFIRTIVPLSRAQFDSVIARFNGLCRGMVVSQLVIALIQGLLVIFAALILGLKNVILLGLITVVFAIIPFLGAALVWWAMLGYLLFCAGAGMPAWKPLFMLVYGALIISSVDNVIRPKLLADSAQINPAIVLIGFIGGFLLFGLPGIFLGPLILSMAELALEVYKQEKD